MLEFLFSPLTEAQEREEKASKKDELFKKIYNDFSKLSSEIDLLVTCKKKPPRNYTFILKCGIAFSSAMGVASALVGHETFPVETKDCYSVQIRQNSMWWNGFSSSNYETYCNTSTHDIHLPNALDYALLASLLMVSICWYLQPKTNLDNIIQRLTNDISILEKSDEDFLKLFTPQNDCRGELKNWSEYKKIITMLDLENLNGKIANLNQDLATLRRENICYSIPNKQAGKEHLF